jgi:hypothetical protein
MKHNLFANLSLDLLDEFFTTLDLSRPILVIYRKNVALT